MAKIFRKQVAIKKHVLTVPQMNGNRRERSRRVYPRTHVCEIYVVQVCGFEFRFYDAEDVSEYIDWFSKKIHPSTRCSSFGDHWEAQTKFTMLPGFIKSGSRRERVLKALMKAQDKFGNGR